MGADPRGSIADLCVDRPGRSVGGHPDGANLRIGAGTKDRAGSGALPPVPLPALSFCNFTDRKETMLLSTLTKAIRFERFFAGQALPLSRCAPVVLYPLVAPANHAAPPLTLDNFKAAHSQVSLRTAQSPDAFILQRWPLAVRSEERRVGKECRSRGSPYH